MHWSKSNPEKWKEYCEKMKGNKRGNGHSISKEHKNKLVEANKNRVWTNESRQKSSNSVKEYYIDKPNPMQGKKHTLEAREKIIQSNLQNGAKGKNHYMFKGSKAKHPIGIAWNRRKIEFREQYIKQNGYICELSKMKIKPGKAIAIHHIIDTRKIIDIIQDINYDWNLMFLDFGLHISLHNWLRGLNSDITEEQKQLYIKRYKIAKEKMKELIYATQKR